MHSGAQIYRPAPSPRLDIWLALGIPERGLDLYESLHRGLPYQVFDQLAQLAGLDKKELAQVTGIPPATLQRRAKAGRFSTEESDRLYRLGELLAAALALFEDELLSAQEWLSQPVRGLGERRPLDMLSTSAETRAVLDLIGRLEHGVFS